MKTVSQALVDEVLYPIPFGHIENVLIKRGIDSESEYTQEMSESAEYKGALADCLYVLIQGISFSESDKSIGTLSDSQRELIIKRVNALYSSIGEETVPTAEPMVFIGG